MKAKLLLVALVPFLVASCDDSGQTASYAAKETKITGVVSRVHDGELGVTCWTANNRAITCLRDDDDTKVQPSTVPVDGGWPADGPARHVAGGPGA